jgi:hypothetical protein
MVTSNTPSAMGSSPKTRLGKNGSSVWHAVIGAMKSVLMLEMKFIFFILDFHRGMNTDFWF